MTESNKSQMFGQYLHLLNPETHSLGHKQS